MIGSSVITRGGLEQGFSWAQNWGCESLQLYVAPSRTWNFPAWTAHGVTTFRDAWRWSNITNVVAHGSLLLNLGSANEVVRRKSVEHLIEEMRRAEELGIDSIVIHPGSHPDRELGTSLIIDALNEVTRARHHTRLLLETVAGQGNSIGFRFEELRSLFDRVEYADRFGICFDTCHVFAAGYDLRGYDGFKRVMQEFDRVIGLNRIECFHVNDSKASMGSRVDRHALQIGAGQIGQQTFHELLRDDRFKSIPMIAEPPDGEQTTADNIAVMRMLRSLATLINDGPGITQSLFG